MIRKQKSKYSDGFYKDILLRSSFAIMLLSLILLIFFAWQTIDNYFEQAKQNLAIENADCYSTLEETLENTERITMFFSLYKDLSPLFQVETDLDIRKAMLQEEARTFITCFDYIANIKVVTPDSVVSYGLASNKTYDDILKYEKVQELKPFVLYATTPDTYPPLLILEYTSTNLDNFTTQIALYSEYLSQYYMSENSYLISEDGIILLAKNYSLIGEKITDVADIEFEAINNGTESDKYLHTEQRFADAGMILTSLTPKSDIYNEIVTQLLILLLGYFFITAIGIAILYLVLGRIYRPIKDVAQVLKYYMPDNESMMESDARFIKKCMQRYSTTQNVDAALLRIRKSQLITLHAQISPHLLGNALEAIKWEIIDKLGYNTQLEHAIASLSLFLEDSYEYQQMITSIGAEIERTKYYADMMVYCFFDRLQIEWEVADDVLDSAIVNMSLQPFIENSISHGFSRKEKDPRIKVHISSADDLIYIEIEDNGRGMSEATLSSIMESLKDDEYGHKHIGIKNSHLKLKLLFGEEYGVTDIQTGETGTCVKITIPKIEAP